MGVFGGARGWLLMMLGCWEAQRCQAMSRCFQGWGDIGDVRHVGHPNVQKNKKQVRCRCSSSRRTMELLSPSLSMRLDAQPLTAVC